MFYKQILPRPVARLARDAASRRLLGVVHLYGGFLCGCLSINVELAARLHERGACRQRQAQTTSEDVFVCFKLMRTSVQCIRCFNDYTPYKLTLTLTLPCVAALQSWLLYCTSLIVTTIRNRFPRYTTTGKVKRWHWPLAHHVALSRFLGLDVHVSDVA